MVLGLTLGHIGQSKRKILEISQTFAFETLPIFVAWLPILRLKFKSKHANFNVATSSLSSAPRNYQLDVEVIVKESMCLA